MYYFYAEEINGEFTRLYQCSDKIKKGDFVVIEGYDEIPTTARVIEILSKYQALSGNRNPEDIIGHVDYKSWQDKRNKELERLIILGKMEDKSKEITLLEKMEKLAGRDSEMAELLRAFKGEPQPTSDNDID